jgi:hypothetical protein
MQFQIFLDQSMSRTLLLSFDLFLLVHNLGRFQG